MEMLNSPLLGVLTIHPCITRTKCDQRNTHICSFKHQLKSYKTCIYQRYQYYNNILFFVFHIGFRTPCNNYCQFSLISNRPDASTFTRCHRLLTSWMESKGTGATPQVLIEALKGVERMDLAQKVKDIMKCRSIVRPKPE